ncbi:MAG: hypothetical protein P4L82_02050 [Ancalomicrobiaceae bacterium]|nr:hypothetical protein [Ancalomicrobiaceae bacterium]
MSRLKADLEKVWGPLPGIGVTGVTGVTAHSVTPRKPNGYNGYTGYASNSVIAECGEIKPVTEREPVGNDDGEDIERAAIIEFDGGRPGALADAFAAMEARCPDGAGSERWSQAIDDAGRLLDRWGATLTGLGWNTADIFEWRPVGCCGLAWEMTGRDVLAVTDTGAALGPDVRTEWAWFARHTTR